jgi:hypothetical protein
MQTFPENSASQYPSNGNDVLCICACADAKTQPIHKQADIILYMRWTDPRLQFPSLVQTAPEVLHAGDYRYFWVPELFFFNGQTAPKELSSALTITPTGGCVLTKVRKREERRGALYICTNSYTNEINSAS